MQKPVGWSQTRQTSCKMVFLKVLPVLVLCFASAIGTFVPFSSWVAAWGARQIQTNYPALYQYDFCELENGNVGQCMHILDCRPAQEDLKRKIRPRLCGFDGLYTIVCCKVFVAPLYIPPTPSTPLLPNTIQPQTQGMPTSSPSVDTNNGPFTSALKTELPIAQTEAAVSTTEAPPSRTSPLKTEQPIAQTEAAVSTTEAPPSRTSPSELPIAQTESSVMTTEASSSGTEELSEKKCQEYINFVIPTTPAPLGSANVDQFVEDRVRAVPKEFPHMAAFGYGENGQYAWQCGGSLISEQFVLTAAHCLFSKNLGTIRTVRLGDLDIYATNESTERQEFNVTDTYPHPDYNPASHYNDIALLKLDRPVIFSEFVRPACLQRNFNINDDFTTTGWGTEEIGGRMQSFLQKAELYSLAASICIATYEPQTMLERGFDKDTQICGGNLVMLVDSCQGDSGGPLQSRIVTSRVSYRIVGVASFGKECGIEPGIYTRVSSYIPWIESVVWKNQI